VTRAVAAPGGAALAPAWVPAFFSNAPSTRAAREIVPVEWWPLVVVALVGYWAGFAGVRRAAGLEVGA